MPGSRPLVGSPGTRYGIDRHHELMLLRAELHAVERFAVGRVALAADVVGDAGLGHQIAFVAGIDEHRAAINFGRSPCVIDVIFGAVAAHAVLQIQPLAECDRHLGLGQQLRDRSLRRRAARRSTSSLRRAACACSDRRPSSPASRLRAGRNACRRAGKTRGRCRRWPACCRCRWPPVRRRSVRPDVGPVR